MTDPLGGINTLWPLFGIANQMLAAIALVLCTVVLFKMKRERMAWVTIVPATWLLVCTLVAGWQKLFDPSPAIGFLASYDKFAAASVAGQIAAPAKTAADMARVMTNAVVDAVMTGLFIAVVLAVMGFGLAAAWKALSRAEVTTREVGYAGAAE